MLRHLICAGIVLFGLLITDRGLRAAPYIIEPAPKGMAEIVLAFDAELRTGFAWTEINQPRLIAQSREARLRDGILFLQEGLRRLRNDDPVVISRNDLTRGIVITLLSTAPVEVQRDPRVIEALRSAGHDEYDDREAFYIRSERERVWIIANTVEGLIAAMPELLESVGYEVLGMGPNWIHVPKLPDGRLVFDLERAGRPSFYLRQLNPTSGQSAGVGTILPGPILKLNDPHDESVSASYLRWAIASRIYSRSMPPFLGHALQAYHRPLIDDLRKTGDTAGFLTSRTRLGLDVDRPAADAAQPDQLWINTDAPKTLGFGRMFVSDGQTWLQRNPIELGINLDLSVPRVREIILDTLKTRAAAHFATRPDDIFAFGSEPEDGAGYRLLGKYTLNKDWYLDESKRQGIVWPRPYALHGELGIDQPVERWQNDAPTDVVFAFSNWLLREFDQWLETLPAAERLTSTGKPKAERVRLSLLSYNYHDVVPHFNLDPRIRVLIAGFPKQRGLGEWQRLASQHDVASAFTRLLPREPSGEYRILSLGYYHDVGVAGIPARWSAAPERLAEDLHVTHASGVRALLFETDFNFGKYGLGYYLLSKLLWNEQLTVDEVTALRERWLQRSFGAGWKEMQAYYDRLLIDEGAANAPATWGEAVRQIEAADARIDPAVEPDAQRRIDDLKQYWYYYYLVDTNRARADSPELIEFAWKGQMSYMVAMHMVVRRAFGQSNLLNVVPIVDRQGPAHYTPAEIARWWLKVLEHWPPLAVQEFGDSTLADGRRAREIDLNDLTRVKEFQALNSGAPFLFNSEPSQPVSFVTVAKSGETIGFQYAWPASEPLESYGPREVPYGVDYWDAAQRSWEPHIDVTMTHVSSQRVPRTHDGRDRHVVSVRLIAPRAGTYRFEVGPGGFLGTLAGVGYDVTTGKYASRAALTFCGTPAGITQDAAWIYIPRGTKRLDLEVWDLANSKQIMLHQRLGTTGVSAEILVVTRAVDISRRGTHSIPLEAGEDGTLAAIRGTGCLFPRMYSIPGFWAKSPSELVIPRAIVAADGLHTTD